MYDASYGLAAPSSVPTPHDRGPAAMRGAAPPALWTWRGDARLAYDDWPAPDVILSDGAYGLAAFRGDPPTVAGLEAWYAPHLQAWRRRARPGTSLWFWNTEIGWATMHASIAASGFSYRGCHVWDKGLAHVAGQVNSHTLRRFPVVTEVCAHYVRDVEVLDARGPASLQVWLRREWERAGLTIVEANRACDVRSAASRKYLARCHRFYPPPPDHFVKMVEHANRTGAPQGRPYFSLDGTSPVSRAEYASWFRPFRCEIGATNVWRELPVRGRERVRDAEGRTVHANQKPLALMQRILRASAGPGDVVWEPFGGTGSASVAALTQGMSACYAEIEPAYVQVAMDRFARCDE